MKPMQGINVHQEVHRLKELASVIRRRVIVTSSKSKIPHLGSCLSCVDILIALYWNELNIDKKSACNMAAHGYVAGMLGAALRLNLIGHIDYQKILGKMHNVIRIVLDSPVPELCDLNSYSPAVDIAMMKHETQKKRLFSN